LTLQLLEAREVPAAGSWLVEPFARGENNGPLPTNWVQWKDGPGAAVYAVDRAGPGLGGQGRLLATGSSATAGRAWLNTFYRPDVEASAAVYLGSLASSQLLVRGSKLDGATPTYYSAGVTSGGVVQLLRTTDGTTTVLATVRPREWVGNEWVTLKLRADGDNLKVFLFRGDSNQYLNAKGAWTRQPTAAVEQADRAITRGGFIGFARPKGVQASVPLDSLKIGSPDDSPNALLREERFGNGAARSVPSGWNTWTANGGTAFSTLSDETLQITGKTNSAARLWMAQPVPTDVQVSSSVYVDSLVPAGLFLRGSWLNSTRANSYELTVKRGLEIELARTVNGVRTSFGKLTTNGWQSGLWVQMSLIAKGDQLRVQLFRADTGQYLGADGKWNLTPAYAMTRTDRTITSGGLAGLSRGTGAADDLRFDNFIVTAAPVNLTAPTIIPTQSDKPTVIRGGGAPVSPPRLPPGPPPPPVLPPPVSVPASPPATSPPPIAVTPTAPTPVVPALPPVPGATIPPVPRNYSHIRVAKLAYGGTELSPYEQAMLKNSIDLIIPNIRLVDDIAAVSPDTQQFLYTNVSNVYLSLLTDWLQYADANRLDRELLFYHVNRPTTFYGMSASAVSVNHFWAAYRGNDQNGWRYYTHQIRSGNRPTALGEAGESFTLGYTEKFREVNFDFRTGAQAGWRGVMEYASAVNRDGIPTQWKTLPLLSDGTSGFRTDGRMAFDPPKDWVPASIAGTDRLYYVRIRTITGTAAQAPVAMRITGRDYAKHDGNVGTIPAFDRSADRDGDGYLNDAEYARRKSGFDARFVYETRLTFPYYGPYRFATNVASPHLTTWTVDYHRRFAKENPAVAGFFVDNSIAQLSVDHTGLIEPVGNYAQLYGNIVGTLNRSLGSKWLITNTAGGQSRVEQQVKNGLSYLEEFGLRPMTANPEQMNDLLAMLRRRRELSLGRGYEILDSYSASYDAADARVMTSTLAMYYIVADPDRSFLMINGGAEPSSSWNRNWTEAIKFDVGRPTGEASNFAKGTDPSNRALTYQVYSRTYRNALVLYKPLSSFRGTVGTTGNATATTHPLDGWYRVVQNNGQLGPRINSISLRNAEGVTLARA